MCGGERGVIFGGGRVRWKGVMCGLEASSDAINYTGSEHRYKAHSSSFKG